MTQAVTGSGYSALCLHIKATVFPKMLFSCQQDDPIPPGWLWALAAWHPVGCILLAPGSAAAQGTPGLLSVVLSCCWRLSRTDFCCLPPAPCLFCPESSSGSSLRVPGLLLAQIPEVWCKQQQKWQRLDQSGHSCQLICFWCCIKTRLTLHKTRIIYDVYLYFPFLSIIL